MKTIQRCVCVLIILSAMFLSSSCKNYYSGDEYHMLGSYIPGFPTTDVRDSIHEVLETDEYGRVLFSFSFSYNCLYGKEMLAYAVLQDLDGDFIYFYEDVFYTVSKTPDLELLKQINDWGEELNQSQLAKRPIRGYFHYNIKKTLLEFDRRSDRKRIVQEIEQALPSKGVHLTDICQICDYDLSELQLELCGIEEEDGEIVYYFILINSSGVVDFMRIEDIYDYQEDLIAFKTKNGWNYPTGN
ncbi:MAG: hypothetical protein IJW92_05970 [Clostridia bacterium]|nr:hypothetical protein [Clostridia bacterium]